MANKYNIYKIPIARKESLIEKLRDVGLKEIKSIDSHGYTCTFYISTTPDPVSIWWIDLYKDFLEENTEEFKNNLYYGVYLVGNEEVLYAVSLGKSYFYLQNFCDMDFGLNLAARIINPETIKLKNSKYFRSKKNKTITTYSADQLTYESAESIYLLKASPLDADYWGETVSFGRSVQLSLKNSPKELPIVIDEIEKALNEPIKVTIPMVLPVKNPEEIVELDSKLYKSLVSASDTVVSVDEVQTVGVAFVFAGQDNYKIYLPKTNIESDILSELSIKDLKHFINKHNINQSDFEMLNVKVIREEGRNYSVPIKKVLDYIDPEDNYCLIEGTWNIFNDAYIEYLEESVDKIDFEVHESKLDYKDGENEDTFNKRVSASYGYKHLDKVLETIKNKYKIELMDLYKDNTLYFVKMGSAQKVTYCVDQGVNSIRYLSSDETSELMEKNEMKMEKITMWLLLNRKSKVEKLSDIKSLILLMKLSELRKLCIDKGIQFSVRLNYKTS